MSTDNKNEDEMEAAMQFLEETLRHTFAVGHAEPGSALVVTALRRVCSWCQKVMAEGTPGAPTTHGICPDCERKWFT